MLAQLVAVGYVRSVFPPSPRISTGIVSIMLLLGLLFAAVRHHKGYLPAAIIALGCSAGLHLYISLMPVLKAECIKIQLIHLEPEAVSTFILGHVTFIQQVF
ncbi:MAG: hypothetical protein HRU20_23595 [Pseudomonadales bacterium]|nr:hypothetical protein [Pseudomonadales bacterium]